MSRHTSFVVSIWMLCGACAAPNAEIVALETSALESEPASHIAGKRGGSGCPLDPPNPEGERCLFGEVFWDIRDDPALELASETWIRAAADLDALTAAQLLLAVQQSSHTDVSTADEALARVDQGEVRLVELVERATGRAFRALEYGAGDNSYGAFFEAGSPVVVASIHDGDLIDCTITQSSGSGS